MEEGKGVFGAVSLEDVAREDARRARERQAVLDRRRARRARYDAAAPWGRRRNARRH